MEWLTKYINTVSSSTKGKLDLTDVVKLVRNGVIVAVGAFLAYISGNAAGVNVGEYTPIIVPLFALAVDAAYRWFKDNTKVPE